MTLPVLVNDRPLGRRWSGISVYLSQLARHWPSDASVELRGFRCGDMAKVNDPSAAANATAPDAPGVAPQPMRLQTLAEAAASHRAPKRPPKLIVRSLRGVYSRWLAAAAKPGRYSLYFEPDFPAAHTKLPCAATVHDLSVIDHPEWHPADRVLAWERAAEAAPRFPTRWITVSQFSKRRMVDAWSIAASDIEVIPLAARPMQPLVGEALDRWLRASNMPRRYFVALGTLEPRKNHGVLLDAWAMLDPAVRQHTALLLIGGLGWDAGYWQTLSQHPMAGEVRVCGHAGAEAVASLLSRATALLMPSHYEGFGLPLVEAMACGTPIVCSDIPVFHEVLGIDQRDAKPEPENDAAKVDATRNDAPAWLLDKDDPTAWSQAIARLLQDNASRDALIERGKARVKAFDWDTTAAKHHACLERVIAEQ